jgi:DnaA family protein
VNQLLLDLARPQPQTLNNFAAGHNSELLALLTAWLQGTTAERCVYLWGVPGSGKSHLCARSTLPHPPREVSAR